jgi:hypothetical protein
VRRVERGVERFDRDDAPVPDTDAAGDLSGRGDHPWGV